MGEEVSEANYQGTWGHYKDGLGHGGQQENRVGVTKRLKDREREHRAVQTTEQGFAMREDSYVFLTWKCLLGCPHLSDKN